MNLAALALLSYVTIQRLGELAYARRNTLALMAKGAREAAAEHYPYMVALHAVWLAGLWIAGPGAQVVMPWLCLFAALQVMRFWVLATLGGRWTTRIVVLPGEPLVAAGPYRLLRHPNYAVVVGEIAVLPLALGMPWYALVFSILNGIMLAIRIRAENRALATLREV